MSRELLSGSGGIFPLFWRCTLGDQLVGYLLGAFFEG